MSDFGSIYDSYVRLVRETFSPDTLQDSVAATPEELAGLRETYGRVPDDLLALLSLRNGDNQTELLPPYRLSPCDHIVLAFESNRKCWAEVDGLVGSQGWGQCYPAGTVKLSQSWREHWIAIGDCNGDDLFIDMDPAPGGTTGQVVFAATDGMTLKVYAGSLAELFEKASSHLRENSDEFSFSSAF